LVQYHLDAFQHPRIAALSQISSHTAGGGVAGVRVVPATGASIDRKESLHYDKKLYNSVLADAEAVARKHKIEMSRNLVLMKFLKGRVEQKPLTRLCVSQSQKQTFLLAVFFLGTF
jgi:hypothetical protein